MSVEPERNIEKDLRAYAQQRRNTAGPSSDLHPATRKLLQDEAARLGKSGGAEKRSLAAWLFRSWPRFAFTAAAVVAAAMVSLLFVKNFSQGKAKQVSLGSQNEMAKNKTVHKDLPDNGHAFKESKVINHPAEPRLNEDGATAATSKVESARPAAAKLDEVSRPKESASAATAPIAPPPAPVAAATRNFATHTNRSSLSLNGSGQPAEKAEGFGAVLDAGGQKNSFSYDVADAPFKPVIQPFRRIEPPGAARARAGENNSRVLASFQVEQAMDKLRMIDSDGSVYAGFVSATPEIAAEFPLGNQKVPASDGTKKSSSDKELPLMRFYRFRVSGTNRTLNQEVVFTGNFFASNSVAPVGLFPAPNASFSAGGTLLSTNAVLLELRKMRLQGTLLINQTNNREINALPVKR